MKPIRYWNEETAPKIGVLSAIVLLLLAIFWQPVAHLQQQLLQAAPLPGFFIWPAEVIVCFLVITWGFQLPRILREAEEHAGNYQTYWLDGSVYFDMHEIRIDMQPAFQTGDVNIPSYIITFLVRLGIETSPGLIIFQSAARAHVFVETRGEYTYVYRKSNEEELAHLWRNTLYISQKNTGLTIPPKEEFTIDIEDLK